MFFLPYLLLSTLVVDGKGTGDAERGLKPATTRTIAHIRTGRYKGVAESSTVLLCYAPETKMRRIPRHLILIVLLAIVLFAPLFEFFDQTPDLDQNSDLVRALLCIFAGTTLCLICRRVISFIPRLFRMTITPRPLTPVTGIKAVEAAVSPPERFSLLGSLRI